MRGGPRVPPPTPGPACSPALPRSTRPPRASSSCWSLQILHEDDFVLLLVVDQLIDLCANHQEAEAASAETFFLADPDVFEGIARVGDRGMIEILQLESRARICD